MGINSLTEQAEKYVLSDEIIEKREKGRLSFVAKFPLDKLKDLAIDEFVQGTDENSFCYWLEFKKIGSGIGGGNASKFGIYRTKEKDYATGSGKSKVILDEMTAQKYYAELMSKILKALEYAKSDEIEKIIELEITMRNMVILKILSIYYPQKFLTIGSAQVLIKCAKKIGLSEIDLGPKNSIQINYECKKILSKNSPFLNWHHEKIGAFIWELFKVKKMKRKESKQYWLYSPGTKAQYWDEFYQEGIMAIGWDEIGDLAQFKHSDEIKKALVDAYGGTSSKMHVVCANDDFLIKVKIGDIIIAKKGKGELLGYGVVTSDYIFDKDRPYFQKTRKVDWKLKGSWKVPFNLITKTLTDVTIYPSEHPDYDTYYEKLMGIMDGATPTGVQPEFPLNTILYGPPGTGKTYNTILRAAEIVENRVIDRYEEALEIFNANLHHQIEFITFHQNYSYEDFIQGLRPETDNKSSLVFNKKDGVFKKIADRALENLKLSEKDPEEISNEARFGEALELFSEIVLEMDDSFKINETAYIFDVEEDAFRYTGDKWANTNGLRMKFSDLKEFYRNNVKSRKDVKLLSNISGLARQHATYYYLVYAEILKYLPEKVEGIQKNKRRNFVIIIDEINRANISRVFGELITLIEPDKRSHGAIPLEARLPSGDSFMVPSNLFIIGTMNTADKSIALLDIALRRRFEFESMYPEYEIEGKEIYDVDILKKINDEIIKSKGHDFQIGHAYFMGDNKSLVQRMNKKVIPLLLEYYMNDEKEVRGILRKAGLEIAENSWPLRIK